MMHKRFNFLYVLIYHQKTRLEYISLVLVNIFLSIVLMSSRYGYLSIEDYMRFALFSMVFFYLIIPYLLHIRYTENMDEYLYRTQFLQNRTIFRNKETNEVSANF